MRIDFPQGVPDECVLWLNEHVGPGLNLGDRLASLYTFDECAWFYERRFEPAKFEFGVTSGPGDGSRYIPSITIRDGTSPMATMFALRWSGS